MDDTSWMMGDSSLAIKTTMTDNKESRSRNANPKIRN